MRLVFNLPLRALFLAAIAFFPALGSAQAQQAIPLAIVKSDIPAAVSTRVSKGLFEGLGSLIVREVMPYSVSVGANPEGDVVIELKTTTNFHTAISYQSAARIQAALRKGDEWCSIVDSEGVDAKKLIDGWDTTGTQVSGSQQGKQTKVRMEIWIETSGNGKNCFIGVYGKAGYQTTRFFLPRSSLRYVHDAIVDVPSAAAVVRDRMKRTSDVVDRLK